MAEKSTPKAPNSPKKRKKITISYLENAGAYYLERFSASTAQFYKVMERKIIKSCHDHPEQDRESLVTLLNGVVEKFTRLGYLNDDQYTRTTFENLKQRGLSKLRIEHKLREKGIDAQSIDNIINQNTPDDKKAVLIWVKRKKLGAFSMHAKENMRQKDLASLARAGFDYQTAKWALNLTSDEIESYLIEQA